jgi:PAS domain S-box-containing protein
MRRKILGWLVQATPWGLAAVLALLMTAPIPTGAFTDDPSAPNQGQRTEQDRCKFLMENVRAIVLSLNREGEITFLNHYGQSFFGYSEIDVLGKPMLGTLTPLTGFGGRDMAAFLAELVRHPNRYAFSVHENMLRSGERVTIFWANKGIFDDQGEVREVVCTENRIRLDARQRLGNPAT